MNVKYKLISLVALPAVMTLLLIVSIQQSFGVLEQNTQQSWQLMKKGEQATEEAVAAAGKSGSTINPITEQFHEIDQRGQEIRSASESQQRIVKSVTDNMERLEQLSLQGDSLSTDGLLAAQEMVATVNEVTDKLGQFRV
ncbi:hypothetical protein [Reinekea marinisedimentorum]|uniref:Methyl-accepting chemotaxis protein n=1 Tax=Reinekea marinisedimentorum TaxID=230495 RepID=A0A4R3IDF9_9GAMM|nr:hypothetical protein [Reinekea marinisedimentorum]TCS43884.1 hypothetical protein BCF53_101227 [Reinekea marinisedimentorum]